MPACNYCNSTILFGGEKDRGFRYCNNKCLANGRAEIAKYQSIPDDILEEEVLDIHDGPCPSCKKPGPIDLHTSHTVWSAFILCSMKNKPEVCCRSCAIHNHLSAIIFSGLFGWWGLPFGFILTPIQIIRNILELIFKPNPNKPSQALYDHVRMDLANELLRYEHDQQP